MKTVKLFKNDPIVRTKQTCFACPSQWDVWTGSGLYVYLRYRYGHGSVDVFFDGSTATEVAAFQHGDRLDGIISLDDFVQLAGLTLAPNATRG